MKMYKQSNKVMGRGGNTEVKDKKSSEKNEATDEKTAYLRDLRRSYSVLCASFAGGSGSKEFACNVGNPGSVPVSGRSPGGRQATHSSTLAWRIPWTEEPGGLQSMGS